MQASVSNDPPPPFAAADQMAAADPHQSGGGPSMWAPLFGSTAAAEPTTVRAGVSRRPEQTGIELEVFQREGGGGGMDGRGRARQDELKG